MSSSDQPDRPMLRVIAGGEPTPDEVAALVIAVAVATAPSERRSETVRSRWADRAAALRRPLRPGPGAWRVSAWR